MIKLLLRAILIQNLKKATLSSSSSFIVERDKHARETFINAANLSPPPPFYSQYLFGSFIDFYYFSPSPRSYQKMDFHLRSIRKRILIAALKIKKVKRVVVSLFRGEKKSERGISWKQSRWGGKMTLPARCHFHDRRSQQPARVMDATAISEVERAQTRTYFALAGKQLTETQNLLSFDDGKSNESLSIVKMYARRACLELTLLCGCWWSWFN